MSRHRGTVSDIFIRPVANDRRVAKLLFIMGATWHNKCLFDLDAEEESTAAYCKKWASRLRLQQFRHRPG